MEETLGADPAFPQIPKSLLDSGPTPSPRAPGWELRDRDKLGFPKGQ